MAGDELLRHLVSVLEELDIPYALAGSIASIAYGEPRATLDIDVVVELAESSIAALSQRFPAPDYYMDAEAAVDAVRRGSQFTIIHPSSGLKVDVFPERDEVAVSQLARRRRMAALPGLTATFSPPEELILKKLIYYEAGGSDKHLRDIRAMLDVSADEIEQDRVTSWADRLGLADLWALVSQD